MNDSSGIILNGETILHYACKEKIISYEIVKLILESKCSPNIKSANSTNGKIPLHYVLEKENVDLDLLKLMLEYKSNCNIRCKIKYNSNI
jgi:ankyrin repeat protein